MAKSKNAIEQIYDQLMTVFGGDNPNQYFTMLMPGTNLNQSSYAYDTSQVKPQLVAAAESLLVDQMFDIAQVTGSSNGQRVSDQYMQALSVLVPNFNKVMPVMKNTVRGYLNSPAPADAELDGKPFTGNLSEYYFALYQAWLEIKSAWDTEVQNQKNKLSHEGFQEWYEEHADGRLAEIDAGMGRLLSVFSPNDMRALLGALEAGPGGEIEEALQSVLDIRLPTPDGGYAYPVDLTPNDWFLDLASDEDPVNLLQDPQFIALEISARRAAIMASISQVQAMLAQQPTPEKMRKDADALSAAQKDYTDAQNALVNQYTANTVTAVEMYLDAETGGAASEAEAGEDALSQINKDVEAVAEAKGEGGTAAAKKDGSVLSADDIQKLLDGQNKLVKAQSDLLTSAQNLAQAGMNLASDQASTFGALPVMLARLKSQLAELSTKQSQLESSAGAAKARKTDAPRMQLSASDTALQGACHDILSAITAANSDKSITTAAAMKSKLDTAVSAAVSAHTGVKASDLASVTSAISTAAAKDGATAKKVANAAERAVQAILSSLSPSEPATSGPPSVAAMKAAQALLKALQADNAALNGATSASAAKTAVTQKISSPDQTGALKPVIDAMNRAVSMPNATASSVVSAATAAATDLGGAPKATKSLASDRYMSLQLSFEKSAMTNDRAQNSSFSQTSWSVDLFFGSASGSDENASSNFSEQAFDSDTAIQIGMKAAKVDVQRAWMNPGILKLTRDMSRLSNEVVSAGNADFNSEDTANLDTYNEALFPCFPVAFVIVKDVNIVFKTNSSSLNAVKSVTDSKSAAGGGFLCFSVSHSSASHDASSHLATKSENDVVTISIPGPQILGWFMEFTPEDHSEELTSEAVSDPNEISVIQFVKELKTFAAADGHHNGDQPGIHAAEISAGSTVDIDLSGAEFLTLICNDGEATVTINCTLPDGTNVPASASPFTLTDAQPRILPAHSWASDKVQISVTGANIEAIY